MKHYIALRTLKTIDGQLILTEGEKLNPVHNNFQCFGKDSRNLFWTDDFLNSKPELFQLVKP
jgi:hypothetical protein